MPHEVRLFDGTHRFAPSSDFSINFTGITSPTKINGPTGFLALETTSTTTFNETRHPLKGGMAPSNQLSGQATWLATPNLVLSVRMGRSYLNDQANNYIRTASAATTTGNEYNNPVVFAVYTAQYGSYL